MTEIKKSGGNFDEPIIAGDEAERFAVVRAEQEDIPRMPETPEEMVDATLNPVTGCADYILLPLSRHGGGNLSGLQDILFQINARLLAYLKSEETVKKKKTFVPSTYARHVLSASWGHASIHEVGVIADITAHIVAELNPMLHAAWSEYSSITEQMTSDERSKYGILKTIEEFFAVLDQGRVEQQRVFSFFGVLKEVAREQTTVPILDSRTVELPKEIVLTDPLGVAQKEYWTSRQRAYTTMERRDISLQTLVSGRTLLALNVLFELALSTPDEELKEAAEHIGFWLEGERMQVEGLSDKAFEKYTAGLHFGYGDPEILLTLLNSLETVKQKEPELYVRIMGRAPRPLIPTDARSDLFGNLLHVALFRSLHMESGKGTEGYQILQSFLTGLTQMDTHQEVIAPLSEEEIQAIGEVIEKDVQSGSFMAVAMAPMFFKEGRDAYMLGKLLEKVSAENREGLLQELRNATPDEFVRLMNSKKLLPGGYLGILAYTGKEFPSDVKAVLLERGLPSDKEDERLGIIAAVDGVGVLAVPRIRAALGVGIILAIPNSTNDEVKEQRKYQKIVATGKSRWEDISNILWKSTPSEKLLTGDEFYNYLQKAADTLVELQGKFEKGIKKYEKKGLVIDKTIPIQDHPSGTLVWMPALDGGAPYEVSYQELKTLDKQLAQTKSTLNDILNAHPDITGNQWQQWPNDIVAWRNRYLGTAPRTSPDLTLKDVKEGFQSILRSFMAEQILESPSQFFSLVGRLFPFHQAVIAGFINSATSTALYKGILDDTGPRNFVPGYSKDAERELPEFGYVIGPIDDKWSENAQIALKNLHLLSKLFRVDSLAVGLDIYFAKNPGALEPFCEMLSREERELFFRSMCVNASSEIRARYKKRRGGVEWSPDVQSIQDLAVMISAKEEKPIDLMYVLLCACSRAIPEEKEYGDLKEIVGKGYVSYLESHNGYENHHSIHFAEEEKSWVLEEWQELKPNLYGWKEIARG